MSIHVVVVIVLILCLGLWVTTSTKLTRRASIVETLWRFSLREAACDAARAEVTSVWQVLEAHLSISSSSWSKPWLLIASSHIVAAATSGING